MSAVLSRSAGSGRCCLTDGSRLIVESLARTGADVFVGYPITPANLLYAYAFRRIPLALAAPDEITALHWMAGFAACGHVPVTATSYPGFALMVESVGMAHMMELPMVIVLAQRLGPSTGSATTGAQGDLLLARGLLSGGYAVPVVSPADFMDCWELSSLAVHTAVRLRTPVVLLTSKEMVMTQRDFDIATLPPLTSEPPGDCHPVSAEETGGCPPRLRNDLVPEFVPVGNSRKQVRLTASTHDRQGIHRQPTGEALANTRRLQDKVVASLPDFTRFELDEQSGADTIVVAWDVTALAARSAVAELRPRGRRVSLLVPKTLCPVPSVYVDILSRYRRVVIAEENLTGQLREMLFGCAGRRGVVGVNAIGRMIAPAEIAAAVEAP